MIKGKEKQTKSTSIEKPKYVGFTSVELRAVNPSRKELNKMMNREDGEDDTEITYLSEDREGNDRIRIAAWLYDGKLDTYFVHSFNITNKQRVSKDGTKYQYINSVGLTTWSDSEDNLPVWFTHFLDKDKNEIGTKKYRKALVGEEELATLVRATLGGINWNDPETEVMLDMDMLFKEDYTEIRSMIDGDYDRAFVILTGVKTDENDASKQYQSVYGKSFLPNGFMEYIRKMKFPSAYAQKIWTRFEDEVTGEYGFTSYYDLTPIKSYDANMDVATSTGTKTAGVTPTNSKF